MGGIPLGSGLKTSVRPEKMCLTKCFTIKVPLKLYKIIKLQESQFHNQNLKSSLFILKIKT